MILPIITAPHSILKDTCNDVKKKDFDYPLACFIDDMIETAVDNNLVGLAANQVGVRQRIFIIDMNSIEGYQEEEMWRSAFQIFINPNLSFDQDSVKESGFEGCASLPNVIGKVKRYKSTTLTYFDIIGNCSKIVLTGWLARIAQHEMNHLDGILMIDIAEEIKKIEE
jgi:peptide deformylase